MPPVASAETEQTGCFRLHSRHSKQQDFILKAVINSIDEKSVVGDQVESGRFTHSLTVDTNISDTTQ